MPRLTTHGFFIRQRQQCVCRAGTPAQRYYFAMKVHLTRASVAMSDDVDAPYTVEMTVADDLSVAAIIDRIFYSNYLASIAGGKATWSAISNIPLAVLAQQWAAPKFLTPLPPLSKLDFVDNTLALYFNYHTQQDPDLVYKQLHHTHLRSNQKQAAFCPTHAAPAKSYPSAA